MTASNDLSTHRTWQDWLGIAIGLLVVFAPWIVDETANKSAVLNATVSGIAILLFAEFEVVRLRRWPEAGQIALGLWVALAPLAFAYGGALRISHIVLGLGAAALGALELSQRGAAKP